MRISGNWGVLVGIRGRRDLAGIGLGKSSGERLPARGFRREASGKTKNFPGSFPGSRSGCEKEQIIWFFLNFGFRREASGRTKRFSGKFSGKKKRFSRALQRRGGFIITSIECLAPHSICSSRRQSKYLTWRPAEYACRPSSA